MISSSHFALQLRPADRVGQAVTGERPQPPGDAVEDGDFVLTLDEAVLRRLSQVFTDDRGRTDGVDPGSVAGVGAELSGSEP